MGTAVGARLPYAFTEQGVAMLSSVLGSSRAIAINIEIMRTFVLVRALAATHQDLAKRLSELEETTEPSKRPIGFVTPEDRKRTNPPEGSGRSPFAVLATDRAAARWSRSVIGI